MSIQVRTSLVGQVLDIRRRGLEELLSDSIAVQMLGPSAIFATHEIFMTSDLDYLPEDDSWYPPDRYRLRLMLKVSNELGSWPALRKACPQIQHYLEYIEKVIDADTDKRALNKNPLVRISYEWIEEIIDEAVKYTLNISRNAAYPSRLIGTEIQQLVERISFGIPPNESGPATNPNTVDWRSAVLAAWVYRFSKLGDQEIASMKLLQITRKAIDHILLREDFRKAIGA